MADAELRDETADGIEDRVQRVAIASEDHPRRERSGTLPPEGVERLIHDVPGIGLACTRALHCVGNAGNDRVGDGSGKLGLKTGSGAKMMEEIGVRSADPRCHGFQGDGRRPVGQQQLASGFKRSRPALFRGQATAAY